jgi:hypothetical protein
MDELNAVVSAAKKLPVHRLGVLLEMTKALGRDIGVEINPASDLATPAFVEDFSGRLLTYHAFHEQKLTKKTFEYVFRGANQAANRTAVITGNSVNAGADIVVDGVAFSLKTEGAKSMSKGSITISKLMEARWIRDCKSQSDFSRQVTTKVVEHLREYERIITLRAFDRKGYFEYDLVEIPVALLLAVDTLQPSDFTDRTRSGGSSAKVTCAGSDAFTLRLDGSVEKITVSGLRTSLCLHHATWRVDR